MGIKLCDRCKGEGTELKELADDTEIRGYRWVNAACRKCEGSGRVVEETIVKPFKPAKETT